MKPNLIKAEGKASRLLDTYGYEGPAELNLEDLAYALGLKVRKCQLDNVEGRLFRKGDHGIIQVNCRSHPKRQRFSLAHEIGHWELHPDLCQMECSAENMWDYFRSREEIEANHFAASLLVPKKWVPETLLKEDPSFFKIEQLAGLMDVSLTCAARRYVSISKHPLVLVASSKGEVQWSVISLSAEWFYLSHETEIPKSSETFKCISENKGASSMTETDRELWYPDKSLAPHFEILEEVRNFINYGYCLTLLWLPTLY